MNILKNNKNVAISIAVLVLLVGIIFFIKHKNRRVPTNDIVVEVTTVIKKDLPYVLEFSGTTIAFQTVAVKSQVTGQIITVYQKDGAKVKAGDLLFQIDPRNFEDQLHAAQDALLKDQAQLDYAEKEATRYTELLKKGFATQEQTAQMVSNRDTLKAAVEADKANIEAAKLQIEYSKITAPIDGVLGEIELDQGNVVQANSTSPLVTINTISPMDISFSIAEQYFDVVRKARDENKLHVNIKTSSNELIEGKLTFIDNTINMSTGSIALKASVDNTNEVLWPGQSVKVLLSIDRKDSIVIPAKAVQNNQDGPYVFVVNKDNIVEMKKITIEYENDTDAVISDGLSAGEMVVVSGQLRIAKGYKVSPVVAITVTP